MPPTAALDLSKIYRSPILRSRSSVETHREIRRELTDHRLRWGRGDVSTTLYRRELRHLSLLILSYGAEVEVTPTPFSDFALVQMPLRGRVHFDSDGVQLSIGLGEVAVVCPRQNARVLWQPGCEQLIIKLPHALLRQAACSHCPLDRCPMPVTLQCPVWSQPVFKVAPWVASQWLAFVQQLLAFLPAAGDDARHPDWFAPLERAAAIFLQAQQPARQPGDAVTVTASLAMPPAQDRALARLERLEAHIRSQPFAAFTLDDLARVANVTPRTLNTLCRQYRGMSPTMLLRNIRLEGVREKLLASDGASITEVAMEHGFGHLGRFSAYYRERFGELPRQTVRQPRFC